MSRCSWRWTFERDQARPSSYRVEQAASATSQYSWPRPTGCASLPQPPSRAGVELLEKLRADVVIDYSKQDVVVAVLEATEGRGADVVYDSTYLESSMKQSAAVVAKRAGSGCGWVLSWALPLSSRCWRPS